MAELSVIVPVYNVEKYIRKCVETVINQTLADIEIIIVNDGTKDNSIQNIEDIIACDERVVLINKENGGLMSAWMAGVEAANSNYIGFVDSDDWVDLEYFEFLLKKAQENNADIVVGKYISEYANTTKELYRSSEILYDGKKEIKKLLDYYFQGIFLEDNLISYCRWDKLYKKSILLQNFQYFNPKISLGEDINTNCAVIPDCERILVLDKSPFYHYRQNLSSIVNTFNPRQIDNIEYLYNTLMNIAEKKCLKTRHMDIFIGDMIFTQIKQLYNAKIDWKQKVNYMDELVSKDFIIKPISLYASIQGILKRSYISLFLKKKFKICGVVNFVYNLIIRTNR